MYGKKKQGAKGYPFGPFAVSNVLVVLVVSC